MKARRVTAGRALAWQAALASLRCQWRAALGVTALVAASVALVNRLPGVPFARGFASGVLVAALVVMVLWLAWVPSGLADRSNGALAEDWTAQVVKKSKAVWAIIPSLKFERRDIDHVVICPGGIVAIETKWHRVAVGKDRLARDAHDAAAAARMLRLNLRRPELPESIFKAALIVWGPASSVVEPTTVDSALGPVLVSSGAAANGWLNDLRTGPIGQDYAKTLSRELDDLARQRDHTAFEAGRVVRWLARAR
jgi:hypothetical protein